MSADLYNKCLNYDFEKLFKRKGYAYFTKGAYNLNIIGVRANTNGKVTNLFDDILVLIYRTNNGILQRKLYNITTEPGRYYMTNGSTNYKGTAILVPGQYKSCWKLGKHKGQYKALVQAKPVKVYRDNNKNDIYDCEPSTIDTGVFGINIHKAKGFSKQIDKWSAGCQVFANSADFALFIKICEKQNNLYGNSFTYTLIDEKDLV